MVGEIQANYIDTNGKSFILNLTTMQNMACRFLVGLLDPVVQSRIGYSKQADGAELDDAIFKS